MIFFACLSALCALLTIYPYAIYGRILKRLPTRPVARAAGHRESVTLLFCCHDEEANIPRKLANVAALKERHPDPETLAFADASTDRTAALLSARPDLVTLVRGDGRNGKAHGMKRLAARAAGDILVFTDANVTLREDAIDNLLAWYADAEVGGVCGALHYLDGAGSATAATGARYWRLEERLKAEESRTGNVMGADGSIFSLRRALYPDFPDTVLDDLTVSMAAVFAGRRLIRAGDVIAHERPVADRSEEIARKIRIAMRAFHTHLFLVPRLRRMSALDRFKYASRKVLRWFGATTLGLGLVSAAAAAAMAAPWAGAAFVLAVGAAALAAWRRTSGPLASVFEAATALVATQIGVARAMRGRTRAAWSPAKSR